MSFSPRCACCGAARGLGTRLADGARPAPRRPTRSLSGCSRLHRQALPTGRDASGPLQMAARPAL